MFDEHGDPMKDRQGALMPRRGKVPCEAHLGCAKGHWKDDPDLTEGEESVLKLYDVMRASGGSMLTAAERRDDWLAYLFSRIHVVEQQAEEERRQEDKAELRAMILALKGMG